MLCIRLYLRIRTFGFPARSFSCWLQGIADVLQEDEAEHNMLVLRCVHVVAKRIGRSPELRFEPEIAVVLLLFDFFAIRPFCGRLSFGGRIPCAGRFIKEISRYDILPKELCLSRYLRLARGDSKQLCRAMSPPELVASPAPMTYLRCQRVSNGPGQPAPAAIALRQQPVHRTDVAR